MCIFHRWKTVGIKSGRLSESRLVTRFKTVERSVRVEKLECEKCHKVKLLMYDLDGGCKEINPSFWY